MDGTPGEVFKMVQEESVSAVVPILGTLVAILFWGTFAVPMKTKAVEDAKLHPFVFQFYMSVGIFLSSWLVLLIEPFAFTKWGTLAAFVWSMGALCTVPAVRDLGVSVGQGVWSGFVAVTSFLWGVYGHYFFSVFAKQDMRDSTLAVIGLALLILGMLGLALLSDGEPKQPKHLQYGEVQPLLINRTSTLGARALPRLPAPRAAKNRPRGILFAFIVGITGGSTLVPMHFAPVDPFRDGMKSVIFSLSFGMSVLPISCCMMVIPVLANWGELPDFHVRTCALPGISSGVLWNLANIGSIYGQLPPLGLSVGYPLSQCALFVGGIFGIFYYKEITGAPKISAWFFFAFILLGGASILGYYGSAVEDQGNSTHILTNRSHHSHNGTNHTPHHAETNMLYTAFRF